MPKGFVVKRFHNYMILKVLIIFEPKLNLFKSDTYIFMQQGHAKALHQLILGWSKNTL